MKNRLKIMISLLLGLLLLAGLTAGIWHYQTHVLPLQEAMPILKALRSKDPRNAIYIDSFDSLLTYPNASNDLFRGHAAQIVRQEFLKVLQTTEDPLCRIAFLHIVFGTKFLEDSRIQFEAEDWDLIREAADRANEEEAEFMKNANQNPHSIRKWWVGEHEGRAYLDIASPPMP